MLFTNSVVVDAPDTAPSTTIPGPSVMSNDSESSAGSSSTSTSSSADLKVDSSNSDVNGGKSRGPGRPKKVTTTTTNNKSCTWCADNKAPLKYIINQNRRRKEFCSENCVAEFRSAYRKGACIVCDNVIRDNAPHRDYCSTFCLNSGSTAMKGQAAEESRPGKESGNSNSNNNNNNSNNNNTTAENLNEASAGGPKTPGKSPHMADDRLGAAYGGRTGSSGGIFQYEQLNVFDWTVYLKVSAYLFSHGLRDGNHPLIDLI